MPARRRAASLAAVRIIGLMSGTSYDAIDVAAAEFRAEGEVLRLRRLGELSVDHDPALRERIAAALPPAATTVGEVCRLDTQLGRAFGAAAARGLAELCGGVADLVVSPGQTVYHWVEDGAARGTLQLGSPAWVAAATGLPVVADLRSADVARGGQGAPLVPAFDALLLGRGEAALNLGGIANLTVPPGGWDVGPANALIDAAARRYYGQDCDVDGRHAAAGAVDPELLAALLGEPYYAAPPPKSTGKELFDAAYLDRYLRGGERPDDVLATLTELTARTVADACHAAGVRTVYAGGGGVRNPVLMERLRARADGRFRLARTDELGVPAQYREAYAFALLGWLTWHGLPGSLPAVTGAREPAVLGSITPGRRRHVPPPTPDVELRRLIVQVL
jgi:anhydro-N-acetylmuramic acid kinase